MANLKGVIFSLRGVLAKAGPIDPALYAETLRLLRFLKLKGVQPVFATNHDWVVKEGGRTRRFEDVLAQEVGGIPFHVAELGTMGWKPRAEAVGGILAARGWSPREVLYVGHSEDDMRTASNGRVMFLNALWHGEANPYGFQFDSPQDVARFVDCFCLGSQAWFWAVERGDLRVYALAPFTTMSQSLTVAHAYSEDARTTAKGGGHNATFWGRLLAARLYFSGLVDEIDFVTSYPGHSTGSKPSVVEDSLSILAGSLRKTYLPDLIVRHATAQKSQAARTAGQAVGVENQLRTIRLNPTPRRNIQGKPYKNPPLASGKTVLVVDDFCTQGNSLEAARAFIQATGAQAIGLGWLKTINRDYNALAGKLPIKSPYARLALGPSQVLVKPFSYHQHITNAGAAADLAALHQRYQDWAWPAAVG